MTSNGNLAPVLSDLARRINEEHDQVDRALASAVEHGLRAGELLIEAKKATPHGEWLPWIEANCAFSKRTAQAYMRLAREVPKLAPEEAQRVAHLPMREALIELAAPRDREPTCPDTPFSLDDPDWSSFAQAHLDAPFTEVEIGDWDSDWCARKFLHHLDLPPTIALDLAWMVDGEVPGLWLAAPEEFMPALEKVAKAAKGNLFGAAFADGVEGLRAAITLQIIGQRWLVALFGALEQNEKLGHDAYCDKARERLEKVLAATEVLRDEAALRAKAA